MKMGIATRSRRRAPPTIIFRASLINLSLRPPLSFPSRRFDYRIAFRNIAHRNEPKAARPLLSTSAPGAATGSTAIKIWATAEGLVLETFPVERVGEFYEEATRGRSASHHLQAKAALALLSIARACPIERPTSFADPVVTLARAASDTPAGIQLSAAPVFIGAQSPGWWREHWRFGGPLLTDPTGRCDRRQIPACLLGRTRGPHGLAVALPRSRARVRHLLVSFQPLQNSLLPQ